MKTWITAFTLLFGIILTSSCSKNISQINSHNIIGTWVLESYNSDNTITYIKSNAFDEFKPGYIFESDSKLTVRQNSGWCGTPPVSYENVSGSWDVFDNNDNKIELLHSYWAGDLNVKFNIIDFDGTNMIISILP